MNPPFYNDQAAIAEQFQLFEGYTNQLSRLAIFKINSYKLSLVNAAFGQSRRELQSLINDTLLKYASPADIIAGLSVPSQVN